MRISIGFLLTTFAVTVLALPSPSVQDAAVTDKADLSPDTRPQKTPDTFSGEKTQSKDSTATSSYKKATDTTVPATALDNTFSSEKTKKTHDKQRLQGSGGGHATANPGSTSSVADTEDTDADQSDSVSSDPLSADNLKQSHNKQRLQGSDDGTQRLQGSGGATASSGHPKQRLQGGGTASSGYPKQRLQSSGDVSGSVSHDTFDGPDMLPQGNSPFAGAAISRLSNGVILQPLYFREDAIPIQFTNFQSFHQDLQFSQQTFLAVITQWQSGLTPVDWIQFQFSKFVRQMYQTLTVFQNGCYICDPTHVASFRPLATNLLLDIQFALQLIYSRFGSLWINFSSDFQLLKVVISIIFGLASNFGINIYAWFDSLKLSLSIFQACNIPIERFITIPATQLFNIHQSF